MPTIPGMRVIKSGIHGYGCIATRRFKKGQTISQVDGVLRHEDEDFDDTYSLYVDGVHYYDMVDQNRWINHSCDPNCEVEAEMGEDRNGWARIVASRDIEPGEELHYDYAFPIDLVEKCSCGTAKCRGWIVDEEQLPALLRRLERKKRAAKVKRTGGGARPTASSRQSPPRRAQKRG